MYLWNNTFETFINFSCNIIPTLNGNDCSAPNSMVAIHNIKPFLPSQDKWSEMPKPTADELACEPYNMT